MPNRLAAETSPYLLQHAHNPVDWYAWGPEAFEAARSQNKPIFLSVGYSTCYWCHVMERQSFENASVAELMNRHFINIKVDREERPDVDQLYMTAVQVQTHHGGWPMSAFLTPRLEYFYGGTYFPPTDTHGRPGFVTLLNAVADAWANRRAEVEESAAQFTQILRQLAEPPGPKSTVTIDQDFLLALLDRSSDDYDPLNGGFGSAPKFPRQTLLHFILSALAPDSALADRIASRRERLTHIVRHTLDAMMHGGIRDQLGGGFHRYSTDARWIVPHFEIMLYDNAMLGEIYATAAALFGERRYAETARGVFDFVLREMTSPAGAFYTAIDAEVDAREGEPYVWTRSQIDQVLDREEAALFCRVYGIDAGPNFADPHGESAAPDRNVLFVADVDALEQNRDRLRDIRGKLLAARRRRDQPRRDDKLLTAWNGLMISALVRAGERLGESRYVEAAAQAAGEILRSHATADASLSRAGGCATGFLDDHAFMACALLDLQAATGESAWRERAERLYTAMQDQFGDPDAGAFFLTARDSDELPVRQKTGDDTPLPSANAVAAEVALRLHDHATARRVLEVFAESLRRQGEGMSAMLSAAMLYLRDQPPIVVEPAGRPDRPPAPGEMAARVVQVKARQAGPTRIVVELEIADGWHIQANPAAADLVPTSVKVPADLLSNIATITYPAPEMVRPEFSGEPLPVYAGRLELVIDLTAPADLRDRRLLVECQACDDRACLPAVQREITIS